MKVLVGIKRVIDAAIKVRVLPNQKGVEHANIKHSLNPFCETAVEEAVRLKEKKIAAQLTAISIGPAQSQEVLTTALAMGVDRAIHVRTNLEIDSQIYPLIIAKIFQKIILRDNYNLVLLGKQSVDTDYNQTGQMLAGLLNWPQATFVSKLDFNGDKVTVDREIDQGITTLQLDLPAIITCDLRLNTPRFVSIPNIMKAKRKPVEKIELESLGINLKSKLNVQKFEEPQQRKAGVKVQDVNELISKLMNEAKVL